jgi:hypothetical protein
MLETNACLFDKKAKEVPGSLNKKEISIWKKRTALHFSCPFLHSDKLSADQNNKLILNFCH